MDISNIITFIAVATLLVISPGPNGLLITKTVPISGRKAGFANIGGFVAAFYLHGTLSIFGISILLVQSSQAFFIFKMIGAAYLIWIGIRALISALASNATPPPSHRVKTKKRVSIQVAFTEGFFTNVLNPKVSMFYLAAFPQFISINESALNAYILVSAHSIVNFIWFATMVLLLSRIKSATSNPGFKKWLNSVTGLIFIGFGSKLALLKNSQ